MGAQWMVATADAERFQKLGGGLRALLALVRAAAIPMPAVVSRGLR